MRRRRRPSAVVYKAALALSRVIVAKCLIAVESAVDDLSGNDGALSDVFECAPSNLPTRPLWPCLQAGASRRITPSPAHPLLDRPARNWRLWSIRAHSWPTAGNHLTNGGYQHRPLRYTSNLGSGFTYQRESHSQFPEIADATETGAAQPSTGFGHTSNAAFSRDSERLATASSSQATSAV